MTRYAEDTQVSVEKSKAEIEGLLARYGADQFVSGWKGAEAVIAFHAENRKIQFHLPLPNREDKEFKVSPGGRKKYNPDESWRLWEQACRQRWRALALVIKAKLEAVAAGITTFEEEFYSQIILPGGKTLYETTRESVELAYKSGKVPSNLLEWK